MKKKKNTILITGGAGFLGKRLALSLKEHYNVVLSGKNNNELHEKHFLLY